MQRYAGEVFMILGRCFCTAMQAPTKPLPLSSACSRIPPVFRECMNFVLQLKQVPHRQSSILWEKQDDALLANVKELNARYLGSASNFYEIERAEDGKLGFVMGFQVSINPDEVTDKECADDAGITLAAMGRWVSDRINENDKEMHYSMVAASNGVQDVKYGLQQMFVVGISNKMLICIKNDTFRTKWVRRSVAKFTSTPCNTAQCTAEITIIPASDSQMVMDSIAMHQDKKMAWKIHGRMRQFNSKEFWRGQVLVWFLRNGTTFLNPRFRKRKHALYLPFSTTCGCCGGIIIIS